MSSTNELKNLPVVKSDRPELLKVALCLSGQPRFHNGESYNSLKREIIDKYNTDTFIHCWVSKNQNFVYPFATWSTIKELKISTNIVEDLKKLYNPVSILKEEPREFSVLNNDNYLSNNMPSMFYSLKKADELRQRYNENYDFVIRARTDTLLNSLPDLNNLDKNTIYIPDNCGNPVLFNDNFSIAGGNIADKMYNVFDNIIIYSEEGLDYSPEKMWTSHLFQTGVQIKKINGDCQSFVRQ
jgi:hypothetical protein